MVVSVGIGAYFLLSKSTPTQDNQQSTPSTTQEVPPSSQETTPSTIQETPPSSTQETTPSSTQEPIDKDAVCSINAKTQEELDSMIKEEYYEFSGEVMSGKEIKNRIERFALSVQTVDNLNNVLDNNTYQVGTIDQSKQITTIKPPIGRGPTCLSYPNTVYKVTCPIGKVYNQALNSCIKWELYDVGQYNMPYRLNESGDIECMSFNNWDCYWDTNKTNTLNKISNPPAEATKPNVCSAPGYADRNHWCYKGMKILNPTSTKIPLDPSCPTLQTYDFMSNSCKCNNTCGGGSTINADCSCGCPAGMTYNGSTCITDTCRSDLLGGVCNNTLTSSDGRYKAILQTDGNFVVYDNGVPGWNTSTYGRGAPPYKLVMQSDGNLVFYDKNNGFIWANGSNGRGSGPWYLKMQTDGDLVVTDSPSGKPVWSSKRGLLCPNTCGGGSTQNSNCSCSCPVGKTYNSSSNSCVCSTSCPAGVIQSSLDCSCASDTCRSDINSGISTVGIGNTNNSCPNVLISPNKKFRLEVQPDGNLTVIDQTPGQVEKTVWFSGSSQPKDAAGKYLNSPYYLKQQPEGHLVLYNSRGGAIWYTGAYGAGVGPYTLRIFDDGTFGTFDSNGWKLWKNK